ncbi:EpsG family protein [Parablautia muri]|uniref:EpsG family protein n=1 Tax=Parablautia muri TaxID=2320879 RepID=A0A9X5BJE3_9FIRM|nr:EpsG family protein [Parablautia muri]NBJ94042.1 EpsG family protein [Parablautia muri]
MMIYLIVFFISALILYIGTRQKNKILTWLSIFAALFLVCFLAALRDEEVGTDVLTYVKMLFYRARASRSWAGYYVRNKHFEIGYLALNYIISRITDKLYILHYLIEFIICINIVISFLELGKKDYLWFGMTVYYLLYYNQSYNLVRQTISCSFVFLAFSLLRNQKYGRTIFFLAIAISFHISSIIAVLGIVLYIASKKFALKVTHAICLISIVYYLIGERLIYIIINWISIFQKYSSYFLREYTYDIPITLLLYLVFALIESILIYKTSMRGQADSSADNDKETNHWNLFLMNINLISVIMIPFLSGVVFFWRLSLSLNFLSMYTLIDVPKRVLNINVRGKYQKNISQGIVISFLVIYWIVYYVIFNNNETIPYVFAV